MKRRLAVLTAEEDRLWVDVFAQAVEGGAGDLVADAYAWAAVQQAFPRLQRYDGASPFAIDQNVN